MHFGVGNTGAGFILFLLALSLFSSPVFVLQEEYDREKISWSKISFNDNQACLDLICKKPVGILNILDDESNFPKVGSKLSC